jgi:hypothetical protein
MILIKQEDIKDIPDQDKEGDVWIFWPQSILNLYVSVTINLYTFEQQVIKCKYKYKSYFSA